MPTKFDTAVRLLDTRGAAAALTFLRGSQRKFNANTLSGDVSNTRQRYYSVHGMPPTYAPALAAFERAVASSRHDSTRARKFIELNSTDQRAVIHHHKIHPETPISVDEEVHRAFLKVSSAAGWAALRDFQITEEEHRARSEVRAANLHKSLYKRKVVKNADACIDWATQMFQKVNKGETHIPDLYVAVALILTTGRRTFEILSGLADFEPYGSGTNPYHVQFTGQAKNLFSESYCFQSLIPINVWVDAYNKLFRDRYREESRAYIAADRKEELRRKITKESPRLARIASREMPSQCPVLSAHDLRDTYAHIAYHMFGHTAVGFPMFAMRMLGHTKVSESLSYQGIVVQGLTKSMPTYRIEIDYSNPRTCMESPEEVDNVEPPSAT